eukprot:gnl/TRDRNA2_/TRDRNA2_177010_c1_seq1.p1 gnl/TRDRNA2_/TRDRNA2_177010_c1~~gnl/TRDRNA2_/TRDRNA2_177010_c1_seq1.p1  ORF type:complete len:535 (-),score=70.27 gnl/TRDRNA2_/TRDRNA2_177010_c1_seq1:194-1681(-)
MAGYVPKFFVVEEALPRLPNEKFDLSKLKTKATEIAAEEGQVVMDSLGQMRKMSAWMITENGVIYRCYAYWMLGVLLDHYCRCAIDQDATGEYLPFCTTISKASVPPWTEILIRSFGNDQDMFGFIFLGAYQDSRPATQNGRPKVKLGFRDVYIFLVYMLMALPFPQMLHFVFGRWSWPLDWGGYPEPKNVWSYEYMQINSITSDHRWYLLMYLEARVFMAICEKVQLPAWLQVFLSVLPCCLPSKLFERNEYAFNYCKPLLTGHPTAGHSRTLEYAFSWVFRNFGDGCPVYWRWVQWYVVFYIFSFHYIRAIVRKFTSVCPKSATWSTIALASSMTIGVAMGLFHYPNNVLEKGTGMQWVWLEVGVGFLQPALFALGMTYVPLNLSWWGGTTLGCYVFHFYFRDHMSTVIDWASGWFAWDPTGILSYILIVATCLAFTSTAGPLGHYFLISPQFAVNRISKITQRRRREAREQRTPPVQVETSMQAAGKSSAVS